MARSLQPTTVLRSDRGASSKPRSERAAIGSLLAAIGAVSLVFWVGTPAWAQADEFKLTLGSYRSSDGSDGRDLNLRWSREHHTAWVGYYQGEDSFTQSRVGYDNNLTLPFGRLSLSAQAASRGFLGGSAQIEIGAPWFAVLGWGRTNLKPYYNLNFDPNDAMTFGLGWRGPAATQISLYQVRDDRLDTGQRVTHLFIRGRPHDRVRLTLDLSHKRGQGDGGGQVRAHAVTAGVDVDRWFIRLADDRHANFGAARMLRFSAGLRLGG